MRLALRGPGQAGEAGVGFAVRTDRSWCLTGCSSANLAAFGGARRADQRDTVKQAGIPGNMRVASDAIARLRHHTASFSRFE